MSNIIMTPNVLKNLNISKYELFDYDIDYDKFILKDSKSISLLIMEKNNQEIKQIKKINIDKMSNIIMTPDVLKNLNINRYELFDYDVDYDKFILKDYESISLLIMGKIKQEIKEIEKRNIEKNKNDELKFEELRQKTKLRQDEEEFMKREDINSMKLEEELRQKSNNYLRV